MMVEKSILTNFKIGICVTHTKQLIYIYFSFFSVFLFVININDGKIDEFSYQSKKKFNQIELSFSSKSTKSDNWDRWNSSDIYLISSTALFISIISVQHLIFKKNRPNQFCIFLLSFPHRHSSVLVPLVLCCCSKFTSIYLFKLAEEREKKNRQFSLFTQWNVAPLILKSVNSIFFHLLFLYLFPDGLSLSLLFPFSMPSTMFSLSFFLNVNLFSIFVFTIKCNRTHIHVTRAYITSWWMGSICLNNMIKKTQSLL